MAPLFGWKCLLLFPFGLMEGLTIKFCNAQVGLRKWGKKYRDMKIVLLKIFVGIYVGISGRIGSIMFVI